MKKVAKIVIAFKLDRWFLAKMNIIYSIKMYQ